MSVWHNDIKKVFDHGGSQANESLILKFERSFIIVAFIFFNENIDARHLCGFETVCYQRINTLSYLAFARMTATKMAVDLRRLYSSMRVDHPPPL